MRQVNPRTGMVLFLAFAFPMIAQTFQYYPGIGVMQEGWNVLCFLYFVFVYLLGQMRDGWNISKFELYMLGLLILIPVLSAVSALAEFGQPLYFGILSQRALIDIAAAMSIHAALRRRAIALPEIKAALLVAAWGNWLVNLAVRVLLSPGSFEGTPFVTGSGDTESFALQSYFIIFGSLYYAFRGLRTRNYAQYVLALVLLAGAVGKTGGRAVVLSTLATFFFFLLRWERLSRILFLVPSAICIVALTVGGLYLVNPTGVSERLGKFEEALTVVFTGESVDDASANARTQEVPFAIAGFLKHPVVGNGNLSNQYLGGSVAVQGQYFYPADVGLFGILYLYGLAGFVLFAAQYGFAIRAAGRAPAGAYTPLFDALKGVLFYSALSSLANGTFVFDAGLTLVWIAALQACTWRLREVHAGVQRKRMRNWHQARQWSLAR